MRYEIALCWDFLCEKWIKKQNIWEYVVNALDDYPIDVIIYWVDGNDPEWVKEKRKYEQEKSSEESSGSIRYRDWDNLQYIFRGIEKFMPWVHKVFFVTCGHVPSWLNTCNSKIVLVKHSDYLSSDYLPTFSANPIELNFHRIRGLAEHFIVFNDDCFVTRKMKISDFFINGMPVEQYMEYPIMTGGNAPIMGHILVNDFNMVGKYYTRHELKSRLTRKILSPKYGIYFFYNLIQFIMPYPRFYGLLTPHFPRPYLKSSFEELWENEGEYLDMVSHNRFRDIKDVNIYIFRLWNMLKGNFIPGNVMKIGKAFWIDGSCTKIDKCIRKQKYKLICANDNCSTDANFKKARADINKALKFIMPDKSSFEL